MPAHRLTVAAIAASAALCIAAAAPAAVKISKIRFDLPGSDGTSNARLNQEWIELRNFGQKPVSITSWTIRDEADHVYTFTAFTLRPGRIVRLHTGRAKNTSSDVYWNQEQYVWNNDGDTATLRNAKGKRVDTCTYSGEGESTTC